MSSSSSSTSNPLDVTSSDAALSHRPFGHSLPSIGVKLDDTNYLIWKTRFMPFLRAYHMLNIVEGKSTCPSPPANPAEIQRWSDYDQLALGWIHSTVDDFTTTQLIGCTSSHAAWTTLATNFAQQTQARAMQLRAEFDALRKGSLTMTVYLNRAKLVANQLTAIGRPLSPDELLSRVLHGLGPEYANFRAMLNLTERVHTLDTLHGPLLNHEAALLLDDPSSGDLHAFPDGNTAASPAASLARRGRGSSSNRSRPSPPRPTHPTTLLTAPLPRFLLVLLDSTPEVHGAVFAAKYVTALVTRPFTASAVFPLSNHLALDPPLHTLKLTRSSDRPHPLRRVFFRPQDLTTGTSTRVPHIT